MKKERFIVAFLVFAKKIPERLGSLLKRQNQIILFLINIFSVILVCQVCADEIERVNFYSFAAWVTEEDIYDLQEEYEKNPELSLEEAFYFLRDRMHAYDTWLERNTRELDDATLEFVTVREMIKGTCLCVVNLPYGLLQEEYPNTMFLAENPHYLDKEHTIQLNNTSKKELEKYFQQVKKQREEEEQNDKSVVLYPDLSELWKNNEILKIIDISIEEDILIYTNLSEEEFEEKVKSIGISLENYVVLQEDEKNTVDITKDSIFWYTLISADSFWQKNEEGWRKIKQWKKDMEQAYPEYSLYNVFSMGGFQLKYGRL